MFEFTSLSADSGPTNIRIEQATANGFRVAWDIPKKSSCYGLADVVISLYRQVSIINFVNRVVKSPTVQSYNSNKYIVHGNMMAVYMNMYFIIFDSLQNTCCK